MPKKYAMIALTKPVAGREDEYHDWYQNVHLPQIVGFPGFTSAQRYKLHQPLGAHETFPFLTIYEAETDDIDASLGAMMQAVTSGEMFVSDAADNENYTAIYEVFGERVSSEPPPR